MNQRKIQFTPVWDTESPEETPTVGPRFWTEYFWRRFPFSTLISIALLLLLMSCILFLVAFLTNGWGVLVVRNADNVNGTSAEPEEWWEFGLWQCCRNDGFCLGTRWPAFYGAARGFAVLGMFFHILTFAWMLGHQLEKLLDYDICTLSTLIVLCFISAVFVMVSVCCFGIRWPTDFKNEFSGTEPHLSYSFYLAVVTIPLTTTAAILASVDLKRTLDDIYFTNEFLQKHVIPLQEFEKLSEV